MVKMEEPADGEVELFADGECFAFTAGCQVVTDRGASGTSPSFPNIPVTARPYYNFSSSAGGRRKHSSSEAFSKLKGSSVDEA